MSRLLFFQCALVFALALASRGNAQVEYSLREWHGEDGLPNELVQGIAQDDQGYLWIAADTGGLARFNGVRFDVPASAESAFPITFVRSLVKHPTLGIVFSVNKGEMLVWDGKLLRKNPLTEQFSKLPVITWYVQSDGTLWAGFIDGTVEYLRDGHVNRFKFDEERGIRQVISFADDGAAGVWIAAGSFLYHFSEGKLKKVSLPWRETDLRIASSRQGKPWIISRDVVGRWNGHDIEARVTIPEKLGGHYVRALMEDRDGDLWVGTRSQGAYRVAGDRYQVLPTSHRTISSIYQDNEGNHWLGTGGGGLDRLQAKHFRLFNSKSGLLDDVSLSVTQDTQGQIWFANRDGGVARLAKGGVEVMTGKNGWPKINANRISTDGVGGVWFGGNGSLFESDQAGGISKTTTKTFDAFRSMFVSHTGDLWVTGDLGQLGRLNHEFVTFGSETGLPQEPVSCIGEDAQGRILVGTTTGKLLRFANGHFESIRSIEAPPLAAVRVITAEKDGTLWVATAAGLVVIVDGKEHFVTVADGLPDGVISQMLFDDFGAVWLGLPLGIFRLERREIMEFVEGRRSLIRAAPFGKNEGFAHISCIEGYQPNSVKAKDGTLWFTTRLGVLAIDPRVVQASDPPRIYIDQLRIDDAVQPLTSAAHLRSDMHKIEIRFSVLNFTAPERTRVRYRLDGFDEEWIDAGAERKVIYPRLLPGHYQLKIACADDDGAKSELGAEMPVVVVPYWWQTLSFRYGAAAVAIGLLLLAVRARSHRRLREKLERVQQESFVDRERTRIARDIHDELGASLTRISLLTQSASPSLNTESTRACFNEIYSTTTELTRSIDEIVWAFDARHDNLESLVSYFDSFAQGFLSVAKIRYRLDAPSDFPDLMVSSSVRHHLFLAFKETLNNCIKHANATEVFVRIETSDRNLNLVVSDNGYGIKKEPVLRNGGGNGLPNLATRMGAIGGQFIVRSREGGGTEVVLVLPLQMLSS